MFAGSRTELVSDAIARDAIGLRLGQKQDYDALINAIGTSRFVLIGEASHGTHEFYEERARITKRLLELCDQCRDLMDHVLQTQW